MNSPVTEKAFRRLLDNLREPASPMPTKPYWPYPLSEAEMIACYGLRRLTPQEQAAFPGIRLALRVFKVRLTQPPATLPGARTGWVVWAETYLGHFLVCIPGGGTLPVPYNATKWTAVALDIPITTRADAQEQDRQ